MKWNASGKSRGCSAASKARKPPCHAGDEGASARFVSRLPCLPYDRLPIARSDSPSLMGYSAPTLPLSFYKTTLYDAAI